MLRIIFAGLAAVAVGSIGGFALVAGTSAKSPSPPLQSASIASAIVAPSPKQADPVPAPAAAPAAAPKRTAAVAAPTPPPARSPDPPAATATPDKPTIHFDGDRVSIRFGKYKIDF